MTLGKWVLACTALGTLVTACAQENAETATAAALGPGTVATVDGTRLPESVYRFYALNTERRNADELSSEERQRVIDDLVYVLVLFNEAEKRGLPRERTLAAELELTRWQSIARAMTARYREENPATEAEVRALYEENLPRLAATQYKARHILVANEGLAKELIGELDDGADFATLANEHSTDGNGTTGGDLGWFVADSMVEPFAAAVKAMTIGTYSPAPVQTQHGWHVILLEESRAGQAPALETLRTELVNAVERRKLDAYLTQLREAAEVDVTSVRH